MLTILAGEVPTKGTGVFVTTDGGGEYELLGSVLGSPNSWVARAYRTGCLGLVTLTSRNTWQDKVRVRFDMAVDTGDAVGTLEFSGTRFGGFTWTAALDRAGLLTR